MARTRNRMELREQAEAAEKLEKKPKSKSTDGKKKVAKQKKTATAKKRVSKKKKAVAQRLRMMWGVFDNGNNRVALFPYTDRPMADQKASDLTEKGRGSYFVQPVKEPIVEEEPAPEA